MKKSVTALLFFLALLFSTVLIGCEQAPNLNTEPTLSYIFISQKPAKLNYTYEEVLDLTGLVVKAAYSDNSEKVITGWSSSPKEGTKLTTLGSEIKITISYEEKETSFTVSVTKNASQKVLSFIYVSKKPYKLNYERDSQLDLTGIEIKGKYSDGTEAVLENWTASPKEGTILSTSGTITVRISYDNKNTSFTITVNKTNETQIKSSNEFFWGTWVRMDNGKEYNVFETSVTQENKEYKITSSNDSNLYVNEIGSFSKQSDSVIICNNIPYFRKGGSNLEYTLKLVGFEDSIGRAASTPSTISGKKVKGTSVKYPSFVSEAESDEDGTIRGLRAPVAGDVQTITITDNDNTIVVVTGIKVENNGDNMGTIPLSKNGQYSLKVTGTILEEEKDDGYMYGNNYKRYPMTLTITNISDVTSEPSIYQITPEDSRLSIRGDTEGRIGTLKKGATKTINLEVECGNLTEGYLDTGLNISIENTITEKSWDDYVPLRFYKGLMPLTIAAENVEGNNNSALNGFVIYPDGNSQFFAVPQGENKTLFLPTTIKDKVYKLAFSGATVEGNLSESTEMLYTVAINSPTKEPVDESTTAFKQSVRFGEEGNGNNTEDTAYEVTGNSFQAYLSDGEIDYYIINAEETDSVLPDYQDDQINHTNPYFEIIQEDGTTLSGLTFKIKNTNYHNYGFCIFPYKSGTNWENRLENSVMTHAETENNNFLYNFPFVDEGEKYICYVIFTKDGKDYNPYPEGITIRALSGLGETYFLNDKTPNIVISDSGNIVISDIPNKPSLPNITNDYYFIFVYTEYALKESDYIDNLTITYSPSSIINNTLTTNINDRINSKNWSKEDCLFNIGYDFWYNGYKYTITFIDKHSF